MPKIKNSKKLKNDLDIKLRKIAAITTSIKDSDLNEQCREKMKLARPRVASINDDTEETDYNLLVQDIEKFETQVNESAAYDKFIPEFKQAIETFKTKLQQINQEAIQPGNLAKAKTDLDDAFAELATFVTAKRQSEPSLEITAVAKWAELAKLKKSYEDNTSILDNIIQAQTKEDTITKNLAAFKNLFASTAALAPPQAALKSTYEKSSAEIIKHYEDALALLKTNPNPALQQLVTDRLAAFKKQDTDLKLKPVDLNQVALQKAYEDLLAKATAAYQSTNTLRDTLAATEQDKKNALIDRIKTEYDKTIELYRQTIEAQKKLKADTAIEADIIRGLTTQIDECNAQKIAVEKNRVKTAEQTPPAQPDTEVATLLTKLKTYFPDPSLLEKDHAELKRHIASRDIDNFERKVRSLNLKNIELVAAERAQLQKLFIDKKGDAQQKKEIKQFWDMTNVPLQWHFGEESEIVAEAEYQNVYDHPFFSNANKPATGTNGDAVRGQSNKPQVNLERIVPPGHKQFVKMDIGMSQAGVMVKHKPAGTDNSTLDFHLPQEMSVINIFLQAAKDKDLLDMRTDDEVNAVKSLLNQYLSSQQSNRQGITKASLEEFLKSKDTPYAHTFKRSGTVAEALFNAYKSIYLQGKEKDGEYQPSPAVMKIAIKLVETARANGMEPLELTEVPGCRLDREIVKAAVYYAQSMDYAPVKQTMYDIPHYEKTAWFSNPLKKFHEVVNDNKQGPSFAEQTANKNMDLSGTEQAKLREALTNLSSEIASLETQYRKAKQFNQPNASAVGERLHNKLIDRIGKLNECTQFELKKHAPSDPALNLLKKETETLQSQVEDLTKNITKQKTHDLDESKKTTQKNKSQPNASDDEEIEMSDINPNIGGIESTDEDEEEEEEEKNQQHRTSFSRNK